MNDLMVAIESEFSWCTWDNYKPVYLADYASKITGINGITVKLIENFPSKFDAMAMVDILHKTIYLPLMDSTEPLDQDFFRRIKSLLYHECAHLMYPDHSDSYITQARQKQLLITTLSRTIDDVRIEALIGNIHTDIRKDFKFLIDSHWLENYAIPPVDDTEMGTGRFGDYSDSIIGSLYWILQRRYREASLDPPPPCKKILPFIAVYGMEKIFEKELAPLLDPFVVSKDPAWEMAVQILDVLMKYYPGCFPEEYFV